MLEASRRWRAEGRSVGLVPTMGALHAGHLSLVELARGENDVVVVSIFVNPIQFGPGEDFARYPRDPARDARLLHEAEVDAIYEPSAEVMYPPGASTRVHVGDVAERFEGASRPGHFEGVATVVTKLLVAVEPDRAYFGQKDAQQVAVVRRLVRDRGKPERGTARGCEFIRGRRARSRGTPRPVDNSSDGRTAGLDRLRGVGRSGYFSEAWLACGGRREVGENSADRQPRPEASVPKVVTGEAGLPRGTPSVTHDAWWRLANHAG